MKTYKYDSEIVDLVHLIMNNGTIVVETVNESLLVKYFALRGTPLYIKKTTRDIEKDWKTEQEKQKNFKLYFK